MHTFVERPRRATGHEELQLTNSPAVPAVSNGRSQAVAALLEATQALLENHGFGDASRAVLSTCRTILGAGAGLVVVCAAARNRFEVVHLDAAGLELDAVGRLPLPLRRLGARARKGHTVFANNLAGNDTRRSPSLPGLVLKSALFAPINLAGEVAGLLGLVNKPGGFADADARLAGVFAEMAAVAMSRGRTVGGFESRLTALEGQVRDAATQLSQSERKLRAAYESERVARRQMQSLSRRLVDAQESERRKISRELHDEAGQALASLRFGLRLLEREIHEGGDVTGRVAELMQRTDAVIDGLHRLAVDLRPASLDHLGLEAALRQLTRATGSRLGLAVRFKALELRNERLPAAVETALYRIVQEALTNVERHAHATRVDVLIQRHGDRVIVMVEDDGVGFTPEPGQRGAQLGLLGLRERAEALGGTLTLESAPGTGTTVVVEVSSADPHPDR